MFTPPVTTLDRRRFLGAVAGLAGTAVIAACSKDSNATTPSTEGSADTAGPTAAPSTDSPAPTDGTAGGTSTPAETGGPFPSDGSNDNGEGTVANVLADPRSVRRDVRANLDGSDVQDGVPFELTTTVVDTSGSPLPGAAVYIWHCNRDGEYSQYNSPMLGGDFTDVSWLRGVQIADDDGKVTFTTILPGRYPGRAFHIHFAVYADATYGTPLLTSQMAIDDDLIDRLYADAPGYEAASRSDTDNARDGVFADGVEHQLLAVTGDVAGGVSATFTAVV